MINKPVNAQQAQKEKDDKFGLTVHYYGTNTAL
jgi:hypothetical protein